MFVILLGIPVLYLQRGKPKLHNDTKYYVKIYGRQHKKLSFSNRIFTFIGQRLFLKTYLLEKFNLKKNYIPYSFLGSLMVSLWSNFYTNQYFSLFCTALFVYSGSYFQHRSQMQEGNMVKWLKLPAHSHTHKTTNKQTHANIYK